MVTRIRLNVTFIRTLSVLLNIVLLFCFKHTSSVSCIFRFFHKVAKERLVFRHIRVSVFAHGGTAIRLGKFMSDFVLVIFAAS
jgi:hypothetical protein